MLKILPSHIDKFVLHVMSVLIDTLNAGSNFNAFQYQPITILLQAMKVLHFSVQEAMTTA
jgi:hypothetical protein